MASGPGETFDAALPAGTPVEEPISEVGEGRVDARLRGDLRGLAAKGIVINAVFLIALNALGFIRSFGVASFLSPEDYGLWGLLAVAFTTLFKLIQVGVDDKYIQQDAEDQVAAFEEAFTLQCMLCGAFVLLIAAAMPLYALAYDDWNVLLPGYLLALAIPPIALQTPLWTYYRNMDFLTQRKLGIFDPIVGFVVTLGLAALGFGYWSLVIGVVAGAWASAIVAVRASPYKLRWRFNRETMRSYWGFSGPLFYSALVIIVIAQVPVLVGKHAVGLLGVGAMAVSNNISQYASRVDDIVTNTLYPAVCAVKDRRDLLLETFTKSNRLAMLWATPVGAGIALFGPDIVHYLLGEKWHFAIFAIQVVGVTAAINQIGFNWSAFYRARGETRPMATSATITCVGVLAFAIPLLITHGVNGYVLGMGVAVLMLLGTRVYYLGRLFPLRAIWENTVRGVLPAVPGILAVVGIRLALWGGSRTTAQVALEMAVFGLLVAAVTIWSERKLLREFRGYLSGRGAGIRSALEPS